MRVIVISRTTRRGFTRGGWKENAMKLDSSVSAVVTGGASGLGKATVKALRELGVKVAISDPPTLM